MMAIDFGPTTVKPWDLRPLASTVHIYLSSPIQCLHTRPWTCITDVNSHEHALQRRHPHTANDASRNARPKIATSFSSPAMFPSGTTILNRFSWSEDGVASARA